MLNVANGKFMLGLIHDVLSDINVPHWFISGTCLGLIREGNLMANDTDIDIAIPWEENSNMVSILAHLEKHGFVKRSEMKRDYLYENIGLERNGVSYELNFLHKNDKYAWITWVENGKGKWITLAYPISMFEGHSVREGLPVPNDPENFLRMTYGEDWKIPNPSYYHGPEGFYLTGKEARRYDFDPTS